MIAQVVVVGGAFGTATRAVDAVVQLGVAAVLWRTARHTHPSIAPWWAALAGVWAVLGIALALAPVGLAPSAWTPWMVHGTLIILGPVAASVASRARKTTIETEASLRSAIERNRR